MRLLSAHSSRAGRARLVLACALVAVAATGCGFFKRGKADPPPTETKQEAGTQPGPASATAPVTDAARENVQGQGTAAQGSSAAPASNTAGASNTATAAPSTTTTAQGSSAAPASNTAGASNAASAAPSVMTAQTANSPNGARASAQAPAGAVGTGGSAVGGGSRLPAGVEEVLQSAVNPLPPGAPLPKTMPIVVTVTGGELRGEQWPDGTVSFRGIPYARPPVGGLRWKPPEPAEPWTGVREAVVSGPPCSQAPLGWNNKDALRSREDCLYLDVRTPAFSPTARKPVMVWIHGGANWAGSGSGFLTSSIVQRGVVLVTVQYRLGVFGFLSHPALTAESKQKSSGNYALLDQIAALQWVKANIAKLGGDPNNVTIFGHSAGGQDVGLLMLSPLAKGLFAKAIQQSGTAGFGLPPRTLAENEKLGEAFAAAMGVPASSKAPLEKMRAAYATALLAAGNKLKVPTLEDDSFVWLQPVVDGWVLPRAPADLLVEHKQSPVPLLIGSASRELTLFGGADNVRHTIEVVFGANTSKAIPLYGLDQLRTPPDDPRLGDMPTQLAADINFRCPVTIVSKHHQATGAHVWQYQLDRAAPGGTGLVSHGAELPYVFDGLPIYGPVLPREPGAVSAIANAPVQGGAAQATPVSSNASGQGGATQAATVSSNEPARGGVAKATTVSSTASSAAAPSPSAGGVPAGIKVNPLRSPSFADASLQAYWVRFAMTGDPNGPGLPRWPEYTRNKRDYIEFTEGGPIAKRDLRAAQCDLLSRP